MKTQFHQRTSDLHRQQTSTSVSNWLNIHINDHYWRQQFGGSPNVAHITSGEKHSKEHACLFFPNIVHYKLIPQDHSQHGSSTVTDSLPYLQVSASCDCIFFFKLKFKWKDCWFDTEQKIKPAAAAARKQVVWMELPGSNLKIARITSVVRRCTVKHPWS